MRLSENVYFNQLIVHMVYVGNRKTAKQVKKFRLSDFFLCARDVCVLLGKYRIWNYSGDF